MTDEAAAPPRAIVPDQTPPPGFFARIWAPPSDDGEVPDSPVATMRSVLIAGVLIMGIFVGGLIVWSIFAPLESAAVAQGVVEVESSHRTVQHLEDGIVSEILVKDGDQVVEGQPLVRLDPTKARTTYKAVQGELWDFEAREARLIAERDGRTTITYSDDLLARSGQDAQVAQVLAGQTKIFETRRDLMSSKIALIRQRIVETNEEIVGLRAQGDAAAQKLVLIDEELRDQKELQAKGLTLKPRVLQLGRDQADIAGTRGQVIAQIARAQQTISEAELSIIEQQNDAANEVSQQLRDTEEKSHELQQQLQAAADVLARIEVRAPVAGTVTGLKLHTPGGVVSSGEPLLDIVPNEDKLVITAKVRPEDMDLVRVGLPALVRLLPYKQRRTPPLEGTVSYVSADRTVEKEPNQPPYFAATIEVDKAYLNSLADVHLVPGMPAEVMIRTGKTTVALYALSPILDSFHRAFIEK